MAREIKVVARGKELSVRNIPDDVSKGERVVAARWQADGNVLAFSQTEEEKRFLDQQVGYKTEANSTITEFYNYLWDNWGEEKADSAFSNL